MDNLGNTIKLLTTLEWTIYVILKSTPYLFELIIYRALTGVPTTLGILEWKIYELLSFLPCRITLAVKRSIASLWWHKIMFVRFRTFMQNHAHPFHLCPYMYVGEATRYWQTRWISSSADSGHFWARIAFTLGGMGMEERKSITGRIRVYHSLAASAVFRSAKLH